jgi:hypothetical protein
MLENPELRDWLGGVEPAWPLLGAANVIALRGVRALSNGPVRIDWSLSNPNTGRKFRAFSGKVFPLLSEMMVPALECPLSCRLRRLCPQQQTFTWPFLTNSDGRPRAD